MNLSLPLFDFADDLPDDAAVLPGAAAPGGLGLAQGAADALAGPGGPAPAPPGDAVRADEGLAKGAANGLTDGLTDGLIDGADAAAAPSWSSAPGFDLARHPAVWRASQMGGGVQRTTATGFEALDAQLPGGGWPHGVLTELLLPQPGIGELRLLAPALAGPAPPARVGQGATARAQAHPAAAADAGPCVMLFDPPAALSAWALAQCGLSSRHWLVVRSRAGQGAAGVMGGVRGGVRGIAGAVAQPLAWRPDTAPGVPRGANRLAPLLPGADLLWALEQSLKSGHVGAVLAWLPVNLRADALRRLQLAAQAQAGPVFIFRDALACSRPSPAPLRLLLQPAGVDGLSVRLLKRRGPLLAQALRLVLPPVLPAHLQAQAEAQHLARGLAAAAQPVGRPTRQPAR